MGIPAPRDALSRGRDTDQRLDILEARIGRGIPARLSDTGRGPTAERDVYYGVPTTTAQRVALANRNVTWFNTDTGWEEGYFATTGAAGLTARGLITGYASGWYPLPGSHLVCTRIKTNDFQTAAAGTVTAPTLISPALVNIGGFTMQGVNAIIPPFGAYFNINSAVYWSGGGPMVYRNAIVRYLGGAEIISARIPNTGADGQIGANAESVLVPPGQAVELVSQSAAADNIYGDGLNRRTFLTLKYAGPPLVNG